MSEDTDRPSPDLLAFLRRSDGVKPATMDTLAANGFDSAAALLAMDVINDLPLIKDINIGQRVLVKQVIRDFKTLEQVDRHWSGLQEEGEDKYKRLVNRIKDIIETSDANESKNEIKRLKTALNRNRAELWKAKDELKKKEQEVTDLTAEVSDLKKTIKETSSQSSHAEQGIIDTYGKYFKEKDDSIEQLQDKIRQLSDKNSSLLDHFQEYTVTNHNNLKRIKCYLTKESMAIHDSSEELSSPVPPSPVTSPQSDTKARVGATPRARAKPGPKPKTATSPQDTPQSANIPKTSHSLSEPINATAVRRTGRIRKPSTRLRITPEKKTRPPSKRIKTEGNADDSSHNLVFHVPSEEAQLNPNENDMTFSSITAAKLEINLDTNTDESNSDTNQSFVFQQKLMSTPRLSYSDTSNGYLSKANDENLCSLINTVAPSTSTATTTRSESTRVSAMTRLKNGTNAVTKSVNKAFVCSRTGCDFASLFENVYEDHIANHVTYHFGQELPDSWRQFYEPYKQTLPHYSKAK